MVNVYFALRDRHYIYNINVTNNKCVKKSLCYSVVH